MNIETVAQNTIGGLNLGEFVGGNTLTIGELLVNNSFADALDGWDIINPSGGYQPRVGDFGAGVLNINRGSEAAAGDGVEQTIQTISGQSYDFSINLREGGGISGNHDALIEIIGADGQVVESRLVTVFDSQSTNVSFSFVAESFSTTVRITNPSSTNSFGSDLLIDSVSVIGASMPQGELITNAELEGDFAAAWTILNPTGGSAAQNGSSWYGEDTTYLNGGNETRYGDGIEQSITTFAGGTYKVSVDLGEGGGGHGHHQAKIEIIDGSGDVIESKTVWVYNAQWSTHHSFEFEAMSNDTIVRITNPTSTNSWYSDLLIHKVSVIGDTPVPLVYENGVVSQSMVHDSDGLYQFNGTTYHFHGRQADGSYIYGVAALEDDVVDAYELSSNDIDFLMTQAKLGVVDAKDLADVSDARGIRELDGFGNNVENSAWGNADQLFARLTKADYEDGISEVRDGPNPRNISNEIVNQNRFDNPNVFGPNAGDQDRNLENNFRANEFTWAFGQYFDHGLDFLPKGGVNEDGTVAGRIDAGNATFPLSLSRGSVAKGTGIDSQREHVNVTSPYIDQNQAYGSNDLVLEFLLERDGNGQFTGRLLSGADGGVPTLGEAKANWQLGVDAGLADAIDWNAPDALSDFRGSGDSLLDDINPRIPLDLHLVAGDGRVNENAALSVVHTIWKNNHNFWVDKLLEDYLREADGSLPDDLTAQHLFEMAKIINGAEYQRAVFDEFVELLVGSDVHTFRDYNPNINADITHEFAAAAYRLGHSMLNNTVTVADDYGNNRDIPLFDLFLNPVKFRELGAANIMDGMIDSLQQEIDSKIVTTMRNNLLGQPIDLASLNIARGRDVGLPTLNDMREMSGLSRYEDWDDFGSNLRYSSDLGKFKQAYKSVDDVDLWVGGLAEKPSSSEAFGSNLAGNSTMGTTFAQVFSIQMIALQDGDRFYYKHRLFETELRLNIQSQDFADIVERTLGLEYLQADILQTIDKRLDYSGVDKTKLELEGTSGHDVIIGRNIGETISGKDGDDTIFLKAGNDTAYGGDGDDALHGGAGDDYLEGGSGDDRADGGAGNDTILAGHGDDDISGNEGNDFMDGGEDNDEVFGGDGKDELYGGSGNDNVWGGLGQDKVYGGDGNDNITGNDGNDYLEGGSGNDVLIGGSGADIMVGGSGYDEYGFLPGSGYDVIKDFVVGEDRIDVHRYVWEFGEDAVNINSLQAGAVNGPKGAILTFPDDSRIVFEGVSKAQLFSDTSHTFIMQDRIFGREGLILDKQTGIVVDAGTRNIIIEDEVTGEVTIIEPELRHDFTVKATSMMRDGFGLDTSEAGTSTDDFSGGGWGWSDTRSDVTNDGNIYLGGHGYKAGNIETTKTFDVSGSAVIEFDFFEIDSWDGETFYASVNGQEINLGRFYVDNVYGNRVEGNSGSQNGISWEVTTGGYQPLSWDGVSVWSDEVHSVRITVDNVRDQLTLGFGSTLNEGYGTNEAWGVDNLEITGGKQVVSLLYPEVSQVVTNDTFDAGGWGWSDTRSGITNDGNTYLGGHGYKAWNIETTKTYELSGHGQTVIEFDFLEIDSWDGENFYASVNGQVINLGRYYVDNVYGDRAEGNSWSSNGVTWEVTTGGYVTDNFEGQAVWSDEIHNVKITAESLGDQLTLGFGSTLNEGYGTNEAWGVDNLVITETRQLSTASSEGTLSYSFDGEDGGYDVVVNAFDENDGMSRVEVVLNGDVMETHVLDDNYASTWEEVGIVAESLFIQSGDEIEIRGYQDAGEWVRITDVDFIAINDPYETLFV